MREQEGTVPVPVFKDSGADHLVLGPEGPRAIKAREAYYAPALAEAVEELLSAYAPRAEVTVALEGVGALHPAVAKARSALSAAKGGGA